MSEELIIRFKVTDNFTPELLARVLEHHRGKPANLLLGAEDPAFPGTIHLGWGDIIGGEIIEEGP